MGPRYFELQPVHQEPVLQGVPCLLPRQQKVLNLLPVRHHKTQGQVALKKEGKIKGQATLGNCLSSARNGKDDSTISTFSKLSHSLTALEEHLPLIQSMKIVQEVREQLVLEPFASKFKNVLSNNPGFKMLEQYTAALVGKDVDMEGTDPSVPILFSNAPITSVDCERFFSKLKIVLADQRTRLTEAHLRDILLPQWNKDLL